MRQVRYRGEPGGDDVCVAFGATFPANEWIPISKEQSKLLTNPMFEADEDGDGEFDPAIGDLRVQLDELGVKYHHKAGVEKLSALLAEAREG